MNLEQKLVNYIEKERSLVKPEFLKYYMLDTYIIGTYTTTQGKFKGISDKNCQGHATIQVYENDLIVVPISKGDVCYRSIHCSSVSGIRVLVNFTQIHKKNLLLLWVRIWKEKGLIADTVYYIYTFLIQNEPHNGELIYEEIG